ASRPSRVKSCHCHHWSVLRWADFWLTVVSARGSVVVPVKLVPALFETLTRILLAHPLACLTPLYRLLPVAGLMPAGVHPLVSFEYLLMYEPNVTTTLDESRGSTEPDG